MIVGSLTEFLFHFQSSNLARDCIPISQTVKTLPLTLHFRQVNVDKLRKYLRQMDFGDYLDAQNLTQEDDLREKLIESDFEWHPNNVDTGDNVVSDYLEMILLAIFLTIIIVKLSLFALGN